ncbi:MAG: T9SS type A sorting domain-containing protein [Bacteroidota bacterium]
MQLQTAVRWCLLCVACLISPLATFSSHVLSARFEWEQLSARTYQVRVITLSDPSGALVDRCEIDLEVWDTSTNLNVDTILGVPRVNGPTQTDPNFPALTCPTEGMGSYVTATIKYNRYDTVYTFPADGTYELRWRDLARVDNMINIPNSGSQSIAATARLRVDSAISNDSPVPMNPFDLAACAGSTWLFSTGFFDSDGDSLAFVRVPCTQYNPPLVPAPIPVNGYTMPDSMGGGIFWVSGLGNVVWNNIGNILGAYGYAFKIQEWRNGTMISESIFEATVFVVTANCIVGQPDALPEAVDIYPVPVQSELNFSRVVERATLWDLQGRTLETVYQQTKMPLGALPSGIYLVEIEVAGKTVRRKIVVQ